MTGPGEGKLRLNARVLLIMPSGDERRLDDADIYVHLKGDSLARVTHLDIEHPDLDGLLPPKRGEFLTITGINGGLQVNFGGTKEVRLGGDKLKIRAVRVLSPLLNEVLPPGRRTRTWVGGKAEGIYVGFRRAEVRKLETLAERRFGMKPKVNHEFRPSSWRVSSARRKTSGKS